MDDTDLWHLISGIYVATGGEEWITIGNFKLNTEMHGMKLISPGFVNDYYKYCSYYFIDNVQVFEADNPHILPADMLVCEKDFPVNVTASPDLENYHWSTGETAKTITSSQGGLYTLEANKGACALRDTIKVTLSPTPVLDLGADIDNCEAGILKTVTLKNSTALFSYSWSTGAYTAEIDVTAAGTYRLSTYDYCGTFADEVVVLGCEPFIYVPNVFAPAIAGINGVFLPQGQNVRFERLVVFNNWGVMVYQEDMPTIGWNGTYNLQNCPPGVYVWHLSYRTDGDSKILTKHGDVTLIR
jgi:gliding motility-associated-like protein